MAEQMKFTAEEMQSIQTLQQRYSAVAVRFGQLYMESLSLERRVAANQVEFENAKRELSQIEDEERKLAEGFEKKYGQGRLNLATGDFTPVTPTPQQ